MLQKFEGESAQEQADRDSNYLILRTLQHRLPPAAFEQVLRQVSTAVMTGPF